MVSHAELRRYDVAILGGAIMGSSAAYFLKMLAPSASICVVEPDPTYEFCSTLRVSGGVRVLFSCPENIEMSKFCREFIQRFPKELAVQDREAPVDWGRRDHPRIVSDAGPCRFGYQRIERAEPYPEAGIR